MACGQRENPAACKRRGKTIFCRKAAPRQHAFPIKTLQCRVTATSPFDTDDPMDVLVTHPKHGTDFAFDTARIAAAVEALAEKHAAAARLPYPLLVASNDDERRRMTTNGRPPERRAPRQNHEESL